MDEKPLVRKMFYVEAAFIILTGVTQVVWVASSHLGDLAFNLSITCLAGALVIAYLPVVLTQEKLKVLLILVQAILMGLACAFGAFKLYPFVFLALGAKTALLIKGRRLMIVTLMLMATIQLFSHVYARNYFLQLHGEPTPISAQRAKVFAVEAEVYYIVALFMVALLARSIVQERKLRAKSEKLSKEVEDMVLQLERARMAREIHDGLGHSLTSLNIQLELSQKLLADKDVDQLEECLSFCRQEAARALEEARKAVQTMREKDINLEEAVNRLTQEAARDDKNLSLQLEIDDMGLSAPARYHIYRIIQECLTNVRKHASAKTVTIALTRASDKACLKIVDDGCGFSEGHSQSGFGLIGMRERVESLGGSMNVLSAPGQGTSVEVNLPS